MLYLHLPIVVPVENGDVANAMLALRKTILDLGLELKSGGVEILEKYTNLQAPPVMASHDGFASAGFYQANNLPMPDKLVEETSRRQEPVLTPVKSSKSLVKPLPKVEPKPEPEPDPEPEPEEEKAQVVVHEDVSKVEKSRSAATVGKHSTEDILFHELYPDEDYATCGSARELELNRVMQLIRTLKGEFEKTSMDNDMNEDDLRRLENKVEEVKDNFKELKDTLNGVENSISRLKLLPDECADLRRALHALTDRVSRLSAHVIP